MGINKRLQLVADKLERVDTNIQVVLAKLVLEKWFVNIFKKDWQGFDPLEASKLRTRVAGFPEQFMKFLFELDQVQSNGDSHIRDERRKTVARINKELLPLADTKLAHVERIKSFFEKIVDKVKQMNASKPAEEEEEETKDEVMDVEQADTKKEQEQERMEIVPEETSTQPTVEQVHNQVESSDDNESDEEDMAPEPKPKAARTCTRPAKPTRKLVRPRHEIRETANAFVVRILLPLGEDPDDISVRLENEGECILVSGQSFELPFEVDRRNARPEHAQYQFLRGRILELQIPKVTRVVNRPSPFGMHRQVPTQASSPFDSFFGRRQPQRSVPSHARQVPLWGF